MVGQALRWCEPCFYLPFEAEAWFWWTILSQETGQEKEVAICFHSYSTITMCKKHVWVLFLRKQCIQWLIVFGCWKSMCSNRPPSVFPAPYLLIYFTISYGRLWIQISHYCQHRTSTGGDGPCRNCGMNPAISSHHFTDGWISIPYWVV